MKQLLIIYLILIKYLNFISAIICPDRCTCIWYLTNLQIDCSNLNLTELPDFNDLPIVTLNLSYNRLKLFPSELSDIQTLEILNLSNNYISYIDSNALDGFNNLQELYLNSNKITNWYNINPKKILLPALSIQLLSLSNNFFQHIPDDNILISHTLITLNLQNCKIRKFINSHNFLNGLINLKNLYLNDNSLRIIPQLQSDTLEYLNLKNCNIIKLQLINFIYLTNLFKLDLSENYDLISDEFININNNVKINTLHDLDISYCNMDKIDFINYFPNLTIINLKGNMIRKLNNYIFDNVFNLEYLDLSQNSIDFIDNEIFYKLYKLRYLDLSYNSILNIHNSLFKFNKQLIKINLSRNFINHLNSIQSKSLLHLNLSWCEITKIDINAFDELPIIQEIDLSNNLITKLPDGLKSSTLQYLNLSVCRLSSINNSTFSYFPELSSLDLSGNRFTSTFQIKHFSSNLYLQDLWLGDNPWRCECDDVSFFTFYLYLTQNPPKINDRLHLKCESPSNLYGEIWQIACLDKWFPPNKNATVEKIWTIVMLTIIIFAMLLCFASTVRRIVENRNKRRNIRERQRNLEEQRTIRQRNQMILEQEAQLNAPDPRETSPPCYEDALLMPKLERNFKSMDELTTRRSKNKNMPRSKTVIDIDDETDGLVLDSIKFRSEEMLLQRDTERTTNINAIRRTGNSKMKKSRTALKLYNGTGETHFPSSYFKAKNLESAEKIASFHSLEHSPYSRRIPKPFNLSNLDDETTISSTSSSICDLSKNMNNYKLLSSSYNRPKNWMNSYELMQSYSSIEKSPYSQRKPKTINNYAQATSSTSNYSLSKKKSKSKNLNIVDNHFNQESSLTSTSKDEDSNNDFQMMNLNEIEDTVSFHNDNDNCDKNKNDPIVIIHHHR